MSSTPSTHALLGGHRGAVDWLTRFLSLLPSSSLSSSPLPLVTAPVLIAFLTGAGHMLAKTYPEKFQKQVEYVQKSIVPRLDEGEIGRPSSVRLKKVLEGGFDGFQTTLPARALAELYHGASPGSGGHGTGGFSNPSPFGTSTGQSSSSGQTSFAGGSENTHNNTHNPFGGGMATHKDQFGSGQLSANNPLMGGPVAAGSTNNNNSVRDPFGALGNNASNSNAAFGAGSNSVLTSSISPFGGGSAGSNNNINSHASPFGGGGGMSNPSLLGAGTGTTFSSPFGGVGGGNTLPSPFISGNTGGVNANQSPFSVAVRPQVQPQIHSMEG
jgi:hypothetical protein